MEWQFKVVSGDFCPRQFEFRRDSEDIIFGTVSGDVCFINSVDDWKIKKLGKFGVSDGDTILGLCWFKNDSQKFISGSSSGKLYCGEVKDCSVADMDCKLSEFPNFDRLTSVHLNCSNDKLLVSGYSQDAIVYDLSTTQVVQEFKNIHGNFINISRFSNLSPNVFSTSSFDKTVKTWDMRMRNSTSDTEPAPPQQPIYEASCDTGVVMINFSKDDMFVLASCVDNEINQYHFLDGKKHMSFKIPRIESVNNYTRAYYTTSGNHIVTGSCEEKNVKILSTETGEVLSSLEIYDGRKDDSIYVQSLRSSPNDEFTICVLTNYKDLHHRELVIAHPVPTDSLQRDSSTMDIVNSMKGRDTGRKADLFASMNYGFYSPGFAQDLSSLRQELRLVSAALEHLPLNDNGDDDRIVHMLQTHYESHGIQRSEQFFRSQVVLLHHHEGSVCAVEALLSSPAATSLSSTFQEMCLLKDREPASSPRQEITAIHSFILKARCSVLYDRVESFMHGPRGALVAVEISDLVSSSLLLLLPTVVDFIYSGSSAIDVFIIRFHILSELLRCCEELNIQCGLLFQEILPHELFRVIASDINQLSGQVRSGVLVSLCNNEEIWRYPFLSSQLAASLWDLDDLARRLQLLELQSLAEQLIGANVTISNACQSYLIAQRRGKKELGRIIDKFVTSHWKIMCASSRNLLDETGMNEMEAVVQNTSKQYSTEVLSREGLQARQEWLESVCFQRGITSGSDSPVLSIRDEFPFLAGKGVISDSTSLPVYVGHSAVRIFDDQIMFIGGASTDRYHPQSKILLYDIPSNEFKYVYCGGNGMSSSAGVHPSISLQKTAAYKVITAVGKSISDGKPLRYSSLPNSSVYRQRQEHPSRHGCAANDPLSARLSALVDISTPTSNEQLTSNESDDMDLEISTFGKDSTMKGCNQVLSAFPSPGSEYFVHEIFYELDCRSLTWTDPLISVREAFCDVGGSIMHPVFAAAGSHHHASHLFSRGMDLKQGKHVLAAAAKKRLSHSFVPLYDVDVPYRCHDCLFTDKHEDLCSCISRHSASNSSSTSLLQQVKSTWVIQFGGYCGANDVLLDDLHILSYQENVGKESQSFLPVGCIDDTYYKWFKVRASGIPPAVRFGHSAVILPCSNLSLDPDGSNLVLESHTRMVVFGGAGLHDEHCDIGSLRVERHPMTHGPRGSPRPVDLHWEKVVVTGKAPSKRHNHTMITLPESGIMVMFGGICSGESSHVFDDTWCLIPEDLHWCHTISDAQLPVPLPLPIPLGFQSLHGLGREFLAAATASSRSAPPSTLLYGPRFRWEEVSTAGVPPSCRCRHTCTYIGSGLAFIFGGMDESSSEQDAPKHKDSLIYGLQLLTPTLKGGKDSVRGEWLTSKLASTFVRFPGEPAVRQPLCSLAVDLVSLVCDDLEAHPQDDLYDLSFSVEDPYGPIGEGDRVLPVTFFTPSSLIRSRCVWANAVLGSNMSESRSNNIRLPASPATFRTFLRYLYSDCICDSSSNEVCALIELGAQYDLPRLVCLCEGWLLRELRTADQCTVRDLLDFSNWLHLDVLRAACWTKLLRDGGGVDSESSGSGDTTGHDKSSYEDMCDWARSHAHAYIMK